MTQGMVIFKANVVGVERLVLIFARVKYCMQESYALCWLWAVVFTTVYQVVCPNFSNETRLYCGFTVVLLISRVVNAHYPCFLCIHETSVGLFRAPEAMLVTLLVGNSWDNGRSEPCLWPAGRVCVFICSSHINTFSRHSARLELQGLIIHVAARQLNLHFHIDCSKFLSYYNYFLLLSLFVSKCPRINFWGWG